VFLKGFVGTASHPSVFYAEIMAILHGLELCLDNGFRNITCYCDSLQVVSLIKNGILPYQLFANEIQRIQQLLGKDWPFAFDHTFWEGNACADMLAKKGVSANSLLAILDELPSKLSGALLADARGVAFVRE
jgi:ribonuclease HI